MRYYSIINMKILYIVRHAKAEDKSVFGKDFDRMLTKDGINDAKRMGKRLRSRDIVPDIIISSPANRTLQTAKIIHKNLHCTKAIITNKQFYGMGASKIIDNLKEVKSTWESLMYVGHNPDVSDVLHYFCKTEIVSFPKAGIAAICLEVDDWSTIFQHCGILLFFDSP